MSSIVLFDDKKDCCGCGACMNVCPKNAIRMAEDEVGFVYPEIDQNLCVGYPSYDEKQGLSNGKGVSCILVNPAKAFFPPVLPMRRRVL